ncbi:MAG: HPr family phosphocarrier protein [Pseudomonadota bacterium]|nr:HPr family phosphocarrier protein [Pseudomonadota bacterium]
MADMTSGELCNIAIIANQRGLHARAAAKFVRLAENYKADLSVSKDDMRVSARSIMGLMMLVAACGTQVKICGVGADASDAVEALAQFVKRKFDEE